MWKIENDVYPDQQAAPGTNLNAVGVCSRDWNESKLVNPVKFRLLDDDGCVYYYGVMSEDACFDPLDDFGTPNAGCTCIELFTEWSSAGVRLKEPRWMPL